MTGTHAPQPIDVHDMTPVEEYAIDLVVNGARSFAEDDLDEDGKLSEDDHAKARALALRIVRAIQGNPQAVLAVVDGIADRVGRPLDVVPAPTVRCSPRRRRRASSRCATS